LSHASLSRANLSNADLRRTNLSSTSLFKANLSGANLSGADLCGAELSGADLSGANLSRADLPDDVNPECKADKCLREQAPSELSTLREQLAAERDEARAYADQLAAGLPNGMLPKDIEVLREANAALAQEVCDLRQQRDEAREALRQAHKDYGCELRDPNGTIWEHAAKLQDQLAAAKQELSDLSHAMGQLLSSERALSASLLNLIADIRAAVGDPTGKLMQDELVEHCRTLARGAQHATAQAAADTQTPPKETTL
jgi:hypothetical protein